ncbi:MAG: endonuclease III [Candidatus Goldiibacteriota bacterium HGW-Goldbacteria-1]|jgi:endonuclease-3|nr:MAG: endonuclease III [Candidatus Goldiibacteriota bacterium HGW-Goldbacteria-1]
MVNNSNIERVIGLVKESVKKYKAPVLERFNDEIKDPFWVLIPCILSLRSKDETTAVVARRLYNFAPRPEDILKIPQAQLEKMLYSTGFYRQKAKSVSQITKLIIEKYKGQVPDTIEELLTLPGVGRKTANLVVTVAFKKPGICVDTHVHKICNRWGYVKTKNADETEMKLRKILPKKYWIKINYWLVLYGQNICLSVSPKCSGCLLFSYCPRIGVKKSR